MFNHELYATTLARAVDIMRQADAKEQQKAALRALVALSATSSATVRCYDGQLSVDDVGIPPELAHVGTLTGRLAAHGVAEIAIGRGAEAAELLALVRGLADSASADSVKERLRAARSQRIWVLLSDLEEKRTSGGSGRRDSVSSLFEPDPVAAPQAPPARTLKQSSAKREAEEALAAWNEMHEEGSEQSAMKEVDLGFASGEHEMLGGIGSPAPAPALNPVEPEPAVAIPIGTETPLGATLLAVARRPFDGAVLDRLTAFADAAAAALAAGQAADVLRAVAVLVKLEPDAPDGTPRNSYRITLRRVLSREALVLLAPFATDPNLDAESAAVFARAGGDATEVLLGLLAAAETPKERRGYMNALKGITAGHDQVVQMLGHHQWFVSRNVAELAGEMKLEAAVGALGKLLAHADQRVRRAAAVALAKIGTAPATDLLLKAIKEGPTETRVLLASLLGSVHGAAYTSAIVALLDGEEEPDVLRELCLALARIGTPEAVQALERARKSGGVFSRRARALKESAEAALAKVKK